MDGSRNASAYGRGCSAKFPLASVSLSMPVSWRLWEKTLFAGKRLAPASMALLFRNSSLFMGMLLFFYAVEELIYFFDQGIPACLIWGIDTGQRRPVFRFNRCRPIIRKFSKMNDLFNAA